MFTETRTLKNLFRVAVVAVFSLIAGCGKVGMTPAPARPKIMTLRAPIRSSASSFSLRLVALPVAIPATRRRSRRHHSHLRHLRRARVRDPCYMQMKSLSPMAILRMPICRPPQPAIRRIRQSDGSSQARSTTLPILRMRMRLRRTRPVDTIYRCARRKAAPVPAIAGSTR